MDVLGWLWWMLASLLGLVWSLAWFLLGGWVATLAQIGVIVLVIFSYKYGWRQAPQELMGRLAGFGRFAWAWLRAKEAASPPPRPAGATPGGDRHADARGGWRRRQPGDVRINVSTALSVAMLAGLWMLSALR